MYDESGAPRAYNIAYYVVPGAISVTDDMATEPVKTIYRSVSEQEAMCEKLNILERSPDIAVEFRFIGVRKRNIYDGFRAIHLLPNNYFTSGLHRYLGTDVIKPDGIVSGWITFITPEAYPKSLKIGTVIPIYDPPNVIIGYATVKQIFNPILG